MDKVAGCALTPARPTCARTAYRLPFSSGTLFPPARPPADIAQRAIYPLCIQHHLFAHQVKAGHSQGVHTHTYALRSVFLAAFCVSPHACHACPTRVPRISAYVAWASGN